MNPLSLKLGALSLFLALTGLSGTAITVTTVVPAADSGLDVTDYTTAFTVTTHLVSDGAVTILLGEDPVLVEESGSATMNSYFGVFSTHNHDAHQYFKDQTGMSEQDFYNWADVHQAILKFHWSRTGADIIWEWIEPVRGAGYDWDNDKDTDDNIKAYYAQGQINLIATISPARDRIAYEDWWLYEDDFKNYVRAIVERYDGDGIDDADANVRVKMWQAANEVLAWQGKGWTPDQYVTFVTWMEEAVHQADPDARIMLISSQRGYPYMPFVKNAIDDLIAAGVPFDAVDIHNWAPYDNNGIPGFPMEEVEDCRTFLDSRGLFDVEIFTCENGTWFGCPTKMNEPEQTEQEQARFLAQRIAYLPSVGLDHYLWNNLCEWYSFGGDPDTIYNSMGLVSDGAENCEIPERLNTERICYWTYKMLAEALDRPANSFVGQMSLTIDNNRYGYEYEETATAIRKYVLWSWVGDQDVTFPINTTSAHVVNLITDRYGKILEEYDVYADMSGEVTITIHDDPVLVIEFEDTIPYPDSPFGFHPAGICKPGYVDNGYVDAANIGVRWTRPGVYALWFLVQANLDEQVFDFSLYDRQYGEIPTNTHILANIAPQGRIDEGRCLPGSWLPVDEAKYAAFVTATVERYDGDGTDDMPGLVNPIRHWQVGNEPNDQAQSNFAALQRITYQAIKEACADCAVMIGGATSFPRNYASNFDTSYAPILSELAGQYADIFDFHWYGTADGEYRLNDTATGQDVPDHIRATLTTNGFASDLPIWITEMGSYSGDPVDRGLIQYPPQTERQQAVDYLKRFIYPLSRGVQKVFPAFGLIEGLAYDDGYFDHTGLIYDGEDFGRGTDPATGGDPGLGVKKLGYYTYKKMTEKLEGADWSTLTMLHDGTESDHLYLFRVEKGGQPIHIAWWDYFDEAGYTSGDTKNITLTDLAGTTATVTTVVPEAETGQEVTDYETAFSMAAYPIVGGTLSISLGEDPVLVETGGFNLVIESGDYNGDGTSDIAIFRESSGLWAVRGITRLYFGTTSDIPVPGDYDGNGTTDTGIFRGSSGLWAVRELTRLYFGALSDHPIPGDFDGDGSCDVGIFREESGLWAVRGITRAYFGTTGDNPVPGDYSSDGTNDIGIFRGSSGLWALRNISRVYFGSSEDRAVRGDFDGSGACSPAIFRPASGLWAISGLTRIYFGGSSDQAILADYDGDSTDNIGIFRESAGLWAIRGVTRVYFGGSSDIPVTR